MSRLAVRLCLLSALALLLCCPAAASRDEEPPTSNPYANQPYAGCEFGFCAAQDPSLELAFYKAAAEGNVPLLKELMDNPALNLSRNIVPDEAGFSRVMDVALWAAARGDHLEAAEMLLELVQGPQLDDGHLVDLAAQHGARKLLEKLLKKNFRVSGTAMAYAAKYNYTDIMQMLLNSGKEVDLKAAMQAASTVKDPVVLRTLVEAGAMQAITHPVTGRETAHDWQGEYALLAARSGNTLVLELLFGQGYKLRWQTVQNLIKTAAFTGDVGVMRILLEHEVLAKDQDELEEAVDNALKVAAEQGHEQLVAWLVATYPSQAKEGCLAALLRATKFGRWACVQSIRSLCNATATSKKLQEAAWLGHVLTAARNGHLGVIQVLLQNPDARRLLGQLYSNRAAAPDTPGTGAPAPLPTDQDPLIMAAAAGYTGIVEALLPYGAQMCAPCAAAQAALGGHLSILKTLTEGPAPTVLKDDANTIQDSLQVMANALEGGHWDMVEWLLRNHQSHRIGPYFLNAIASQGKQQDMERMLMLLKRHCKDLTYLTEQVYSAMITSALTGQVDLLHLLENSSVRQSSHS